MNRPIAELIPEFPFPLALLLSEYASSGDERPFFTLHRLVDAAELLTRLATMVLLSDMLRQDDEFSIKVRGALGEKFERPSFGEWRELLLIVCDELCPRTGGRECFVTELPAYIREWLLPAVGSNQDDPHRGILSLRNLLAHAGRIGDGQAAELLRNHQPQFELLLFQLEFLSCYRLLGCSDDGRAYVLRGVPGPNGTFPPEDNPEFDPSTKVGRVLLAREERRSELLDLFPLQAFDHVLRWQDVGAGAVGAVKPQIYFRMGRDYLEYTSLDDEAAFSQLGGPAFDRFRALFKLEEWQHLTNIERERRQWLFKDLRSELGDVFVGREAHVTRVMQLLKDRQRGCFWISGKPGVGKSALMARLAQNLESVPEKYLLVPYFFRAGQSSCSVEQFLKVALLHVQSVLREPLELGSTLDRRRRQLVEAVERVVERLGCQVVFLVDGLDEIHRVDPSFVLLPFAVAGPNVVWLCAGREDSSGMEGALQENGAEAVFPDGLPPLDEAAVRAMLETQIGRLKYPLYERDKQVDGKWQNPFIDVLVRKSEGLPLYVRMVVQDLLDSKWSVGDENRLPDGLTKYFGKILERSRVGDSGAVLTKIYCLLVWAQEPVTEARLDELLAADPLHQSSRWNEIFAAALRLGRLMLRAARNPDDLMGWTLYHDAFRSHLRASAEIQGSREVAQNDWLVHCAHWREHDDRYALRHYPAHLVEADRENDLINLLLDSDFLDRKVECLKDPFLAAKDVHDLVRVLLKTQRDADIVRLAVMNAGAGFRRDGVAWALGSADRELAPRIRPLVGRLLEWEPDPPASLLPRLIGAARRIIGSDDTTNNTINARRAAIEVAYQCDFADELFRAAHDRSDVVRGLLAAYIYRFWEKQRLLNRNEGWALLEQLSRRFLKFDELLSRRLFRVYGEASLLVLIHHYNEPALLDALRRQWQPAVESVLSWRFLFRPVLFLFSHSLGLLLKRQPDYQPLNYGEIAESYSHPGEAHRLGLRMLRALADPLRGVAETVEILGRKDLPYDVYLMLVAERVLVFLGSKDPAPVLDALYHIHHDGCRWFRQSALYAGYHVLNGMKSATDEQLDRYAEMTRTSVQAQQATWCSALKTYPLKPHIAWVELVFDRHRPEDGLPRARFIPDFLKTAIDLNDLEYAGRVLAACEVLVLGYGRMDLALDALRGLPELVRHRPILRDQFVTLLANFRFSSDDNQVDRFLEVFADSDLRQRVTAATPTLGSSDTVSWIDSFVIDRLMQSDAFRAEVVAAFARAGRARNLKELLEQVVQWVINLIEGKTTPLDFDLEQAAGPA